MQFNGPTFRPPATVPERQYRAGVLVENQLRGWAISRWRAPMEFATFFLRTCYRNLPLGSPVMFRIEEIRGNRGLVKGLIATFSYPFDAYHLLGQVFYCGCEFIAFTTYNIYTNVDNIFPTKNGMNSLSYNMPDEEE